MNGPLRRLSAVVMVLFLAIMASTTFYQFFAAASLNNDGRNVRALYREYGNHRGPIVAGNQTIAESVPVDTPFGFQRIFSGRDATNAAIFAPVTGFFSIANGSTMVERAENDYLSGRANALWVDRLQNLFTGRETIGASVETTIDPVVQRAAWNALGGQRGAVVAIEPATGRILAMVSKPSYDPNELAVHSTSDASSRYQELLAADHDPLINRAIGALYPPGSTFKLITAAAAMENGLAGGDSVIPAPHRYVLPGTSTTMRNFGDEVCSPDDEMTMHDAMVMSCNTAFAQLAVAVGGDAMRTQAERFGFDDPFEVPMRSAVSRYPGSDGFSPDRVALSGIGQGDVTATPLQMAVVAATIANGGNLMQPYLVDTVRDARLDVVTQNEPNLVRQAISPGTAASLGQMMIDAVRTGTATSAQISGVEVAAKTGTAQWATGEAPHAWIVAYAPADAPQVAVAVIVEAGGNLGSEATGGRVSGPIARAVIEAALGR